MTRWLRRAAAIVGFGLAIAGLVFVALRLAEEGRNLPPLVLDPGQWSALLGLTIAAAALTLLQGAAWWRLLRHVGIAAAPLWAIRIFGIAQLAKYVPGNIMHLAGRQALGMAAGLRGAPLARSIGWEIALHVAAGLLIAILYLPEAVRWLPAWADIVLFVLAVALAIAATARWLGRDLAWAGAAYIVFLAASGGIFALTAMVLGTVADPTHLPLFAIAFVVAWLAGFVTPGAPAGLGIRETLLLVMLGAIAPEGPLLLTIVVHRTLTVAGDLLHFLAAWLIPARTPLADG